MLIASKSAIPVDVEPFLAVSGFLECDFVVVSLLAFECGAPS